MESLVVLEAEVLGHFKNLPITNTLLASWIAMFILAVVSILATRKVQLIPSGLQSLFEIIVDFGYTTVEDLAGSKKAKAFFPIVMTFFLFILFSNWLGLMPGFATIKFEGEHFLRSMNSDLNMTLGLALTSAALTHAFAIYYLGIFGYLKKWFALNPVFLFVGLLELVGEVTKVLSLSLRLFGNIFAGEVALLAVSSIFAFVAPLPFYFLEIIVGFVQAAVFAMLTLVFMVLLSEKHAQEH
ncbi:F0F1 ATP synthase subunit A [Patescibacteria group bacterium]|nr:F0F1 ATP synthase subunit A [Patescibacteria group bacterium]